MSAGPTPPLLAALLASALALIQARRLWLALRLGRWRWLGACVSRGVRARDYWGVTAFNLIVLAIYGAAIVVLLRSL